uniref:Uncharacterized protein n=1 Tax=Oscillatoriales cyanobacterium SpSt-418 TaxID=2282169 RepID=A0A7C3PGI5_9CYAN
MFVFALICGSLGVLLGGALALAEDRQCAQTQSTSTECLTTPTILRVFKGSSSGLLAGAFAAVTIRWRDLW